MLARRVVTPFVVLFVVALSLTAAPAAHAATCTVPSGGYPTLQSAEDDVTCTTINVKAVVLFETVVIDRALTIIGKGGECGDKPRTIIDASPGGVGGTGFTVDADDVTIRDLFVRHGEVGIRANGDRFRGINLCVFGQRDGNKDGIRIDGDDALIKASELHSSNGDGIHIRAGNTGAIIKRNYSHNQGNQCFRSRSPSNQFIKNRALHCDDQGFRLEQATGTVVQSNVIDSVDRGIETDNSGGLTVTGNRITNANHKGIEIDGGSTPHKVQRNRVVSARDRCIEVQDTNDAIITFNVLDSCGNIALQVEQASDTVIEDNRIVNARDDCIEVLEGGGTSVQRNKLGTCGDNGIQVRGDGGYVVRSNRMGHARSRCIWAEDTNDPEIIDNVGTQCAGIRSESGPNPVIRDNRLGHVWESQAYRINCVSVCVDAEVVGNTVDHGTRDHNAFEITADDGGGLVAENTSMNAGSNGFRFDVDGWEIRDNKAISSGQREDANDRNGFRFDDADSNTVTGNEARGGRDDGFHLFNDSSGNTLSENIAINNVKDGFDVKNGSDNLLDENRATENHAEGIENDGLLTDLTSNVAKGNRWDCNWFDGTEDLLVPANTCADGLDPNTLPSQGQVD